MSETVESIERPVYVRCRDGALYKNPLLIFKEGFATFVDDNGSPRLDLVLWVTDPPVRQLAVAERIFGQVFFLRDNRVVERGVPFSKPVEYRQAEVVSLTLVRRIPRPKHHEGTERFVGRIPKGSLLVELVHSPMDAREIECK